MTKKTKRDKRKHLEELKRKNKRNNKQKKSNMMFYENCRQKDIEKKKNKRNII